MESVKHHSIVIVLELDGEEIGAKFQSVTGTSVRMVEFVQVLMFAIVSVLDTSETIAP